MPLFDLGIDIGLGGDSTFGPRIHYRAPHRLPLDPEVSQSMRQTLLDAGKTGIQGAFSTLSAPGDYTRGLLAGRPGERLTGRELTDAWGLTNKRDKDWLSWGAGLATDIFTDPLTYATFGANSALSKGGQALAKQGFLKGWGRKSLLHGFEGIESSMLKQGVDASTISHLRDAGRRIATPAMEEAYLKATGKALEAGKPLGGLVGIGLPFGDPSFIYGTGPIAKRIAGGLDRTMDWLRFGNPVGRHLGALFDNDQGRSLSRLGAIAKTRYGADVKRKALEEARGNTFDVYNALDSLVRANPDDEFKILQAAAANTEGTATKFLEGPEYLEATKPISRSMRSAYRTMLEQARAIGLPIKNLANRDLYAEYMPRALANEPGLKGVKDTGSLYPLVGSSDITRKAQLVSVPGGQPRIDDWVKRFAGIRGKEEVSAARDVIQKEILDDMTEFQRRADPGWVPEPPEVDLAERKAKQITGYLRKLSRDHVEEGKNLFSYDLPGLMLGRGAEHARKLSNAESALRALALGARKGVGENDVPLTVALKRLGLKTYDPIDGQPIQGAMPTLYRYLASKGAGPIDKYLKSTSEGMAVALRKYGIDRGALEGLIRDYARWQAPEELKGPIKFIDSFTNMFKSLAYPIWPASHTRNAMTAFINNLRYGVGLQDYVKQAKLMRGLLPESESAALRGAQYRYANIFAPQGELNSLTGLMAQPGVTNRQHIGYAPGTNELGMSRAGRTGSLLGDIAAVPFEGIVGLAHDVTRKLTNWHENPNPFQIAGVAGAKTDVFAPVKIGRTVGQNIEDFFRGAQYNAMARQGYSPSQIGAGIRKVHFEYSDLTPFEKKVMRRLVPFYTFARFNLPLQIETALTRPRIVTAPLAPFMQDRHRPTWQPDWLNSQVSMPVSGAPQGYQRYLSTLGLPQEEAFGKLKPSLSGTAMELAGYMNPLVKGPLEQWTGTQFYTGRKLEDLRPDTTSSLIGQLFGEENPQMLSQMLLNTPFSRFFTTVDKIADPRKPWWVKAINMGTGAKVTDVDVDKAKAIETRNALNELLRRQPHVRFRTDPYIDPVALATGKLTPEEVQQMRLLTELQRQSREYVEQQRRLQLTKALGR